MKNLILKTTAITLACAIGLLALLYGIFALFIPRPLANLFDKMGMYNSSIHYFEKTYDKSNSLDDLYTLCLKLDEQKDSQKIEKYTKILLDDKNFISFGKSMDTDANGISTEEYIEGKFVRAVYKNSDFDDTLIAIDFCLRKGECYPEYNPFLMLLTDETIDWSSKKDQLAEMKEFIVDIKYANTDFLLNSQEQSFVQRDLDVINEILA